MDLRFFSLQNADRMTDGQCNNVIEPPILLKYPFHQDADDEKAFSGLTTFCAWFQFNLLCIVSVMCSISNQICNQYVSKKLWLHPFLQICREVTVVHESKLFELAPA